MSLTRHFGSPKGNWCEMYFGHTPMKILKATMAVHRVTDCNRGVLRNSMAHANFDQVRWNVD